MIEQTTQYSPPAVSELEFQTKPPLTVEVESFGHGEVIRYTPDVIRADEGTGDPVAPLLYMQRLNGNDILDPIMQYLALNDQRQVIGIRYKGRAAASPKPIGPENPYYRHDAVIPELDAERADDAVAALTVFDGSTGKIDIAAESAGAVRALLVADRGDIQVGNVLLVDPVAQDGRTYRQTHYDALRLAMDEKRRKAGGQVLDLIVDPGPEPNKVTKQLRDRPEQKAVARGKMDAVLAEAAQKTHIRITSDVQDKGVVTERIAATMQASGADKHVKLIPTDKGGHGVGLNKSALDMVMTNLRQMEVENTAISR